MEPRKNTFFPSEIHRYIGNKLNYRDCQSYATSCRSTFFALDNHFFQQKNDREQYLSERFRTIVECAYFAIKHYMMHDNSIYCQQLYFNKGQYRSVRFMLILDAYHSSTPSIQFCILALYTLLTEKNGSLLKNKVNTSLESINVKLVYIEKYVKHAYSTNRSQIKLLQDHILNRIYAVYDNDRHPFNFSKEEIAKLEIEINNLVKNDNDLIRNNCVIL